ncbi:hypothetical protein JW998_03980, partial [candidate division KSB1 bacterium]|nr:hypothetical protein [candidate division KSB1 bacterium]
MKKYITLLLLLPLLSPCPLPSKDVKLSTTSFHLCLTRSGSVSGLFDVENGMNYIAPGPTPLLSIRRNGEVMSPQSMRHEKESNVLVLTFAEDIEASVQVGCREKYVTLELIAITNPDKIELVIWGPYPTSLHEVIGETVGVVQGDTFALGIQALNPRTLGGFPWTEDDCMPQIDIFDQDDLSDLSEAGKRSVLYRVEAAKPQTYGSSLQAYCRNRSRERIIANWEHDKYAAPAYDDGGVIGSKIALFGCAVDEILPTIALIEKAEGLPHPLIDGEWGKTTRSASAAYMIMEFGEKDIDKALDFTQKAGLRYLYHP